MATLFLLYMVIVSAKFHFILISFVLLLTTQHDYFHCVFFTKRLEFIYCLVFLLLKTDKTNGSCSVTYYYMFICFTIVFILI